MIRAVLSLEGALYACGRFGNSNPNYTVVKRWDGGVWSTPPADVTGELVARLLVHDGRLIAGGTTNFAVLPGDNPTKRRGMYGVAALDLATDTWHAMPEVGMGFSPSAAVEYAGGLAIAGSLTHGMDKNVGAYVAHWKGGLAASSEFLGDSSFSSGGVWCFEKFQGSLIAAGGFSSVGGKSINRVARWDGDEWLSMGNPPNAFSDLLVFDGSIVGAGKFVSPSLKSPAGLWNGSTWEPLGTGLEASSGARLVNHQGELVIAHTYSVPELGTVLAFARFKDGQWVAIGPATLAGSYVWHLESWKGKIYAAGKLDFGGSASGRLMCWDGEQWVTLDDTNLFSVHGMTEHNGHLVVAVRRDAVTTLDQIVDNAVVPYSDIPMHLTNGLAILNGHLVVLGHGVNKDGSITTPWTMLACDCPSDCDNSGLLDIDDFICFQSLYAVGDSAADCDGDGALSIDDFACFQAAYAVGC